MSVPAAVLAVTVVEWLATGTGVGNVMALAASRSGYDLLAGATTGTDPRFADVVARLPVAGLSGTLGGRFRAADAQPAAGLARAKTGTLTGVHALAGTVVDADGRLLTYAVLADRAGGTPQARAALDSVVAALATCGCR